MNKKLLLFLFFIFTAHTVQCSDVTPEQSKAIDALCNAITAAREAGHYDNARVQTLANYVSRDWLNENFIEKSIAASSMLKSDEPDRKCILFCPNEKSSPSFLDKMLAKSLNVESLQWVDIRSLDIPMKVIPLLTIYFVPTGAQIDLQKHINNLAFFIKRGDPLVICFEEGGGLTMFSKIKDEMQYAVRHLCGMNPNPVPSVPEEELLNIGNLWKYNIANFRTQVIVVGAVLLVGFLGLILYKMKD